MNNPTLNKKSIFNFFEENATSAFKELDFRFPVEVLDSLLRDFFNNYEYPGFLVQSTNLIKEVNLTKVSNSFVLKIPLLSETSEHLYLGLSDHFCFLILFGESSKGKNQNSKFLLSFDPAVVLTAFDYFYRNHCNELSLKQKKLLIKLKSLKVNEIDPFYVSRFQEDLLLGVLIENNKIKQEKIVEALSYTDESVVITDLSGKIRIANNSFTTRFEQNNKSEFVNSVLKQEILKNAMTETLKNGKWSSELSLKTDKKKEELLLVNCCLYKDELNRPSGFVFSFKDLTELKKLDSVNKQLIAKLREQNIKLLEANKRLVEADRIKTDLLSVVSHELRTPVSSIVGFSELITSRDYEPATVKQFADQINKSAVQLDRLITDYLDVASNQFGISNSILNTEPLNLSELIRNCYEEEKRRFTAGKNFDFEINHLGYDPIIISEKTNLQKLFSSIINNAIKYSPDGKKLTVQILNDKENITVSISDQGIGLTKEQAIKVFDPFYRSDNSITREFTGLGLGLAVCKKIVEIYNGSIWCEPGIDSGTVFYIMLPVNPHKPKEKQKDLSVIEVTKEVSAKKTEV